MEFFLNNVVAPTILSFAVIYLWSKLLKEKIKYKEVKFWLILVGMALLGVLNYWITEKSIRIIITSIINIGFCKLLFNRKLNESIVAALITEIIMVLAEFIFVFIVMFGLNPSEKIIEEKFFGTFITDIAVAIIMFLEGKVPFVYTINELFLEYTKTIKEKYFILGVFLLIVVVDFLIMTPYYKIEYKYVAAFNTIVILMYFFIFLNSIKNQHKLIQISDKYNTTLTSLKEYENILNKYKTANHENKNQFKTIRNMLNPKDKKEKEIMNMIDQYIDNKIKDDEKIMKEAYVIPEGGLRGLIYSKMLYMSEQKINYELNVDKQLNTSDLISLNCEEMLDICKILGVYIDNAIEEVIDLEEKLVNIEIYKEKKELCFSVSNNYHNTIDLEKIEEEGYSTKGEGHGFGLPLTKQLIEKHDNFKNVKQITTNTFTQILKVKIK